MVTYTGAVVPGGPADIRELAGLSITKVAVDERTSNNSYLLRCAASGEQVLIDAAAEPETLLALVGPAGVTTVITTHRHDDHHRALAEVVRATGAEVVAGELDADVITARTGVPVTRRVIRGDHIAVGEVSVELITVSGHTPGSIAVLYDDPHGHPHLFTGDSLFPGGVGSTSGPEASFDQLIDEVEAKFFQRLPDETWFYPGHGNDSTLGAERASLGEWRRRGW